MCQVSVILPAYNAAAHLPDAIDSVLRQTFADFELIVVDDGSHDDTAAVARRYPQVRYVHQANAGVSAARNLGASMARGRFLAFLDADDCWRPAKLAVQHAAMAAQRDVLLSRTGFLEAERDHGGQEATGEVRLHETLAPSFLCPYFSTSTVMVRRDAFERVGGFDTTLRVAEDVDLYLRVLAVSPKVLHLTDRLVFKRQVPGSLGDDSVEGYRQLRLVYERFLVDHPHVQAQLGAGVVNQALRQLDVALGSALIRTRRVDEGRLALRRAWHRGWGRDLAKLWVRSYLPRPRPMRAT